MNEKYVLDKTLKGIRDVRLDKRKVLRATCRMTKYFKQFFSFNKLKKNKNNEKNHACLYNCKFCCIL